MKKFLGIGVLMGITLLMVGCGKRVGLSPTELEQGAEILAQAKQAADSKDWVLAESKLREVLTFFPEEGYENERMSDLKILVSVLKKQEKYEEAVAVMLKQRALLLSQKDLVGAANILNEIGVLRREQKQYDKAMDMYEQCYAEFEKMGNDQAIAIKNNIADIQKLQGKYKEALALLAEIKSEAKAKGMKEIQGFITLTEGEVLEAQGKSVEAKANYEAAEKLFVEVKSTAEALAKEKIEAMAPAPECFANSTWKNGKCECNAGYGLGLNKRHCIEIPDNAHYVDSPTDVWLCDAGFKEIGDQCMTTKHLK